MLLCTTKPLPFAQQIIEHFGLSDRAVRDGVLWGYGGAEELTQAEASVLCEGPQDLAGRQELLQPCRPGAHLGAGCSTRHPGQAQRGAGRLSRLGLRQPQHGRVPLGAAEGMAGGRNLLREDGFKLHGCPLPRRRMRLDQAVTGRSPLFDQTTPMHPLLPRLQSRYQLGTVRAPEKYLPDLGAFRTE